MTLSAAIVLFAMSQKVPPKVQHIDFEKDVIEGTLQSPDLVAIDTYRPPKFGNLIKVRQNFDDKIVKSVDQM